jgi:tryptophan synthase beta chain
MGIFYEYIRQEGVRLIGVEAGGMGPGDRQARGLALGGHARRAARQPHLPHAGRERPDPGHALDLRGPGLSRRGPEHAWLKDSGRAEYVSITDDEALAAFHKLCRSEGIIPALESSHAVAHAMKIAPTMAKDRILLVNLSGRGDKDMHTVAKASGSRSDEPHRALRSRSCAARRAGADPVRDRGRSRARQTVAVMHALAAGGADVIELGVPFSDPMADGP